MRFCMTGTGWNCSSNTVHFRLSTSRCTQTRYLSMPPYFGQSATSRSTNGPAASADVETRPFKDRQRLRKTGRYRNLTGVLACAYISPFRAARASFAGSALLEKRFERQTIAEATSHRRFEQRLPPRAVRAADFAFSQRTDGLESAVAFFYAGIYFLVLSMNGVHDKCSGYVNFSRSVQEITAFLQFCFLAPLSYLQGQNARALIYRVVQIIIALAG